MGTVRKQRLLAEAGRRIGVKSFEILTPNLAVHWMQISIPCALVKERTTALRTTWRRRRPERQLEIDATSGDPEFRLRPAQGRRSCHPSHTTTRQLHRHRSRQQQHYRV